ncbi:DUF6541 family protein [Leucobacter iarius]|uniref:Uncharacterized protein n=1 Tax=Leucobacter iarius TaxID=333963 RepID=A0ABN2LAM1_9MICO
MSWIAAIPAIAVALLLAVVPGAPVAWALRLRGISFIAGSIAASFAVISVASVLAPMIGVPWSLLPVAALSVILTAVLWLVLRFSGTSVPRSGFLSSLRRIPLRTWVCTGAFFLVSGGIIAYHLKQGFILPDNISQTYDNVFHFNAVAEILRTGDSSPLHMNLTSPHSATAFYPTLWHASAALVSQLAGSGIAVSVNAFAIATGALVWPAGMLFLTRPFLPRRPEAVLPLAVIVAAFSAFPYLLLTWGVLYPNVLSTALIPYALGFTHLALRSRPLGIRLPSVSLWVAAIGSLGAATLAQPNALFGYAALVLPLLGATALTVRRLPLRRSTRVWRTIALVLAAAAILAMWVLVRTGDNIREFEGSVRAAFESALGNGPFTGSHAWGLTLLIALGIATLILMKRHRWLPISYLISLALYTIASGTNGPFRTLITGAWYNDANRLAALIPVVAIPLAAVGAALLLDWIVRGFGEFFASRAAGSRGRIVTVVATVVGVLIIAAMAIGRPIATQIEHMRGTYSFTADSALLSPDEEQLLQRLDRTVPKDAVILGDPWSGTAFALGVADRQVVFPHLKGDFGAEALKLGAEFRELGAGACPLVSDLRVDYVLEFGGRQYRIKGSPTPELYRGLRGLQDSPILTEVDRQGDAVLYKITGCKI